MRLVVSGNTSCSPAKASAFLRRLGARCLTGPKPGITTPQKRSVSVEMQGQQRQVVDRCPTVTSDCAQISVSVTV